MAIYRTQKSVWESCLRTHTKPTLCTTSTPTLAALDLTGVSTTGVAASRKPKTLGLAATLRHARNERERAEEEGAELGEEEAREMGRRKAAREEEEGLVLGFTFDKDDGGGGDRGTKETKKVKKDEEQKQTKKEGLVKKARKVVGRAFKGDREKRPKAKEGWWEEG